MNIEKKEQQLQQHQQKQEEHDIVVQIKNKTLLRHVMTAILDEPPFSKHQQLQDSYLSSWTNTRENKNKNKNNR